MGAWTRVYFGFEIIDGNAAISTAVSRHLMITILVETYSATVILK
jgi:hypothetical protein